MSYYPPTDWELKDFYREHADALFRCCSFLTCGKADTAKMVREIFMRMLEKSIVFSTDRDARAWMLLSAYKMSRKPPLPVADAAAVTVDTETTAAGAPASATDGEEAVETEQETSHAQDAEAPDLAVDEQVQTGSMGFPQELQELSGKDRLIAVFYYCEGFRKAEIAKYLGWTTFMVRHRLRRIRKKILQEKGGDEAC